MMRSHLLQPDRLALLLAALLALVTGGCASSGAVPRPFPTPGAPEARPAPALPFPANAPASEIVRTALGLQGTPYRLGGADPTGFDCSGLVQYVFASHGIAVPRVVSEQVQLGRKVRGAVRPGDLVFFVVGSRRVSHVGIALDDDRFIHAPATGQTVRIESLSSSYWKRRQAGARRLEELSR